MPTSLSLALAAAPLLFLPFRVLAEESLPRTEKALPLPVIQPVPDQLAARAAGKRAAVFSINRTLPGGESSMNKGFFLDGSGLALCALRYLCRAATLRFDASDGKIHAK